VMVKQWYDYFKPESVLDLGCGNGIFLHIWTWFVDDCHGIDKSNYAVNNCTCKKEFISKGDILDLDLEKKYDLITAIDLLEHLEYEDLDKAILTIKKHTKKDILISVPFKDDKNINLDPTHKIKESKEWWVKQFKKHNLKIIETPDEFLFNKQMIILKNG